MSSYTKKQVLFYITLAGSLSSIITYFSPGVYDKYISQGDNSPVVKSKGGSVSITYDQKANLIDSIRSSKPDISLSQFKMLRKGMTYKEVERILGKKSDVYYNGQFSEMHGWGSEAFLYITTTYENGRLIAMSQSGL
ncbi:hypothetical protein [Microbulbifer sp. ZKSA002]|uniref:hypothetical protein n=1 Tax=Microbulbifer sp. ZKSA002 TaxID=3243388 RepID=UPI00403A27CC